jgi:hypothetical protein
MTDEAVSPLRRRMIEDNDDPQIAPMSASAIQSTAARARM